MTAKCNLCHEYVVSSEAYTVCSPCVQLAFPFNHFEYESDFLNCISDLSSSMPDGSSALNCERNVFVPFTCDNVDENCPMIGCDPDLQYFNKYSQHISNCDYYSEDSFKTKYKERLCSSNNLSMIHLNIRSAVKNLKNFEMYLNQLDVCFNVIGLSETWFTDSSVDLYAIPGYNSCHVYRSNKRGGGVPIYIKDHINFRQEVILTF